ncbi:MAG: site-specific integrase [Actinobacteria bacterium]|nr:site-specific integrase [Actinomycetota bacterium]
MKPTDFAYYLTNFLSKHLPGTEGCSTNTISAYRDAFKLLLTFANNKEKIKEKKLNLSVIDKDFIMRFLQWIENERGCSVITRNQRLAAIHSFYLYLQRELPDGIYRFQKILSIPFKKQQQKTLNFLSTEAVKALLCQPDTGKKSGRKHLMLLSLMYATAARVQEIADLRVSDVMYNSCSLVKLIGKGDKSRFVPLEAPVAGMLCKYLEDFLLSDSSKMTEFLFVNHSQNKLTRQGITHILKKYADVVRKKKPGLIPETISPHCLRHSRAVHWLQAGVDLIYIRDLLGHVSIQTSEIYARIDGEMKRKALEKVSSYAFAGETPSWQKNKSLLAWLKELN